jgi:quercetin dioxygenase-like cupin family protein
MSCTPLPFRSLDWAAGAHPLERKKLVDGQPVVLLEFAAGFEDPQWCRRGHIIYVLDGGLDLVLDERIEHLQAGDGCVLDRGTRHRATNPGDVPVRLLVVSAAA